MRRISLTPCDYLYFVHHRLLQRTVGSGNVALFTVEVEGYPDPAAVRAAFAAALSRHPVTLSRVAISCLTGRPFWEVPRDLPEAARLGANQAYSFDDLRPDGGTGALTGSDSLSRLEECWRRRYRPDIDCVTPAPQESNRVASAPRGRRDCGAGAPTGSTPTRASAPQEADVVASPVHLEQYALPENRTVFCLRWPHYMMDAEGALLFLTEVSRLHGTSDGALPSAPDDLPAEIAPDDETIDVLSGCSLPRRLGLFRRGFSFNPHPANLTVRPLNHDAACRLTEFGLLHWSYSPDEIARLQMLAKAQTPAGPALYARYLAGCVIRALHRLHGEVGIASGAYLISLPLRVTMRDSSSKLVRESSTLMRESSTLVRESSTLVRESLLAPPSAGIPSRVRLPRPAPGGILKRRPVPGNYLVAPTLCGLRSIVEDKRALLHDISQQLHTYQQAEGDLMQWAMVWMAARLRASWYPLLFKLPLGFDSLSSGFSYYGEAFIPLRTLGGCGVTNLWGAGPLPNPPGWNPNFCRYRDRLTFSLTWNRPSVPDDLARRYAELIRREALEAD